MMKVSDRRRTTNIHGDDLEPLASSSLRETGAIGEDVAK